MAREPVSLNRTTAPFTEASPPDDLQVEDLANGEVLIGDPDSDIPEQIESQFDENLAEILDPIDLRRKGQTLISYYDRDRVPRS